MPRFFLNILYWSNKYKRNLNSVKKVISYTLFQICLYSKQGFWRCSKCESVIDSWSAHVPLWGIKVWHNVFFWNVVHSILKRPSFVTGLFEVQWYLPNKIIENQAKMHLIWEVSYLGGFTYRGKSLRWTQNHRFLWN